MMAIPPANNKTAAAINRRKEVLDEEELTVVAAGTLEGITTGSTTIAVGPMAFGAAGSCAAGGEVAGDDCALSSVGCANGD